MQTPAMKQTPLQISALTAMGVGIAGSLVGFSFGDSLSRRMAIGGGVQVVSLGILALGAEDLQKINPDERPGKKTLHQLAAALAITTSIGGMITGVGIMRRSFPLTATGLAIGSSSSVSSFIAYLVLSKI